MRASYRRTPTCPRRQRWHVPLPVCGRVQGRGGSSDEERVAAEERFKEVQAAYEVLEESYGKRRRSGAAGRPPHEEP